MSVAIPAETDDESNKDEFDGEFEKVALDVDRTAPDELKDDEHFACCVSSGCDNLSYPCTHTCYTSV